MADSGRLRGWKWDGGNTQLEIWSNGTFVAAMGPGYTAFGDQSSPLAEFTIIVNRDFTAPAGTNVANVDISANQITTAATGTHANVSSLFLPGLGVTAGGATTTNLATLIISGPPTGISPTNGPYAVLVTAGDLVMTAGNYRGGPVNAFATTEPTQAVILEAGTAPVGAITTSSGIYATATALNKIIADGTANTVQT